MDTRQFLGMVSMEMAMVLDIALMSLSSSHPGTGRTWLFMKYEYFCTSTIFGVLLMVAASCVDLCPRRCKGISAFYP